MRRARFTNRRSFGALALVASVALTACQTGQRPTLVPIVELSDDPATNTVLERLARAELGEFVAEYVITPTAVGSTPVTAKVARRENQLRTQIGNVVYRIDIGQATTCENASAGCVNFTDDARVSNLNITSKFWGSAFATRLGVDSNRRIGNTVGRTDEIAAFPAACVDIPPSASYCALNAGVLARYIGADVTIELVSFRLTSTDADFA